MLIDVTADDITWGLPKRASYCPVALALKRATGDKWLVCQNLAQVIGGGVVNLPMEANKFITAFDDGQSVSPFQFIIEVKGGTKGS